MSAGVAFEYHYPFASDVIRRRESPSLDLATFDPKLEHPHFFQGRVLFPLHLAKQLLVLSKVVRTHFFLRMEPGALDPVITSAPDALRLEGFSGCCGVYARVDLSPKTFDGETLGHGTTNVDFNTPLQMALARVDAHEPLAMQVGRDAMHLQTARESIVEKKVTLPLRWIKSFTEIQQYQPSLRPKLSVAAGEAHRFIRSFPAGKPGKAPLYVVAAGNGLRATSRKSASAIRLVGTHRLAVIEPLLPLAETLRVWFDSETGISGWEVISAGGTFFLLLSPEPYRGFSGEGQNLLALADQNWETSLRGFDVATQSYFDRELPFDLHGIEKMQPRLKNARRLLEQGTLTIVPSSATDETHVKVPSGDVTHFVRLRPGGDVCSCKWHSRYQGRRGPCKHILAARLMIEQEADV